MLQIVHSIRRKSNTFVVLLSKSIHNRMIKKGGNDVKTKNHQGLRTAVVCFLVFFIGNYGQYQISPIAGTIMSELGIDLPRFSLLFTVCMYPALALSLVSGLLCDRFGAKRCVTIALLLSTVGMLGRIAFTVSYPMTLACTALTGLGCMFLTATSAKILAPHFGEQVGQIMGPVSSGNTLGMFIAMATTAFFPGTKAAYTVSGILAVTVLAAWVLFVRDPEPEGGEQPHAVSVGESLRVCVKSINVWLCGISLMLLMVGQIMVASSLPIALQTVKGMSESATGTVSSVYMIGAILGTTLGPQLFFRLKKGKRIFVTCCALITGIGVAFAWHIPNTVLLCSALVLCGSCLSSFIPMLLSLPIQLPGIGPVYAGTAGGLIATIQMIGCTIIPTNILTPMFTNAANVTDFGALFLVSGILAACAAVTANLLPIYNDT